MFSAFSFVFLISLGRADDDDDDNDDNHYFPFFFLGNHHRTVFLSGKAVSVLAC